MQKLLTALADLIFPPTMESSMLRTVTTGDMLTHYQPSIHNGHVYLSTYKDPIIQAAVRENKFHHNRHAASLLGALLTQWIHTHPIQNTLILPIPLSRKRRRDRGHNQVETIAKACHAPFTLETKPLARSLDTPPQTQLPKRRRTENMQNAFRYNGTADTFSAYDQVVLLDDVVTTGATFNAARATLAPHLPDHVNLTCLAIAH